MHNLNLFIFVIIIILLFILFNRKCENFYIPQNIVTGGDFHIQPPGAIADQGSFTNDMYDYMEGQGSI